MAQEADLLIEAGFSDARLAQEAAKIIGKYKQAGEAAQKAFQSAQGGVGDAQALKAHLRELDKLQKAYDPVYVATKRYEAAVKQLDRALEIGATNKDQYRAQMQKLNVELGRAAGVLQDTGTQAGRFGGNLQNIGFQVGDFATQVGAGTSATQALGQQLPQLLGGFGAVGAAAGAFAAIMIPLSAAILRTAFDSETLDDRMKALEASTDAMASAADLAATPVSELRARYGDLADEIARANGVMATFTAIRAQSDLLGAARSTAGMFGDLTMPDVPVGLDGRPNADRLQMAQRQQAEAMEKLRRETGATAEQMDALVMAIRRLETANGVEATARDGENLLSILAEIATNAGANLEKLGSYADAVGAVQRVAQQQIEATRSEAIRLQETYDATTQDLKKLTADREVAERTLANATDQTTGRIKAGQEEVAAGAQRIINGIDLQITKTKELARETDAAFSAMANRIQTTAEAYGQYASTRRAGQTGADNAAASKGILDLIKSRESNGGDYNVTLDNGAYTGGARDLVNMTIREVLEMQRQMLAHPANKKNSSAAGAYQIVRKTLMSLVDDLGLTGGELYDEKMQDRLAQELLRRRRGQGVEGLRNEWEGLRGVPDNLIQKAMGQQSIPLVDEKVQSERTRVLREETAERERQAKVVKDYGATLAANLVTAEQQAALDRERGALLQAVEAAGLEGADKAAAIAAVNGEYEKQRLILTLIADAKRRQVDLDTLMTGSTLTYAQAITALGDATKAKVIADQQQASALESVAERQQFAADMQRQLKDGLIDSIIAGEGFADVLANVAQMLAKAALQAALFGEGPMAGGNKGGGLLGSLFSGLFKAFSAGGYTGPGGKHDPAGIVHRGEYVMDAATVTAAGGPAAMEALRRGLRGYAEGGYVGSNIVVPRSVGQVIPARRTGGDAMTYAPVFHIGGKVTSEDLAAVRMETAAGFRQMQQSLPAQVQQINTRPRRRT